MAMGSKAFESPLISHERMRAMYRALVETRALVGKRRALKGNEACWTGAAIDLREGDLVIDRGAPGEALLLDHVRAVGAREGAAAPAAAELHRIAKHLAAAKADRFPGSAVERLLCAAGAAMALKAATSESNTDAEASTVALAFAGAGELSAAEWCRVLAIAGQAGLPLVLVVVPESASRDTAAEAAPDLEKIARKAAPSLDAALPVIPVDASDTVALYRVAQETVLRARAGDGASVIEAVGCGTDAVELLGRQLVRKQICTERWVAAVRTQVEQRLARL